MDNIYVLIYLQYFVVLTINSYFLNNRLLNIKENVYALFVALLLGYLFTYIGVYTQLLVFSSVVLFNYALKKPWNQCLLAASISCSLQILFDHVITFILYYNKTGIFKEIGLEVDTQFTFFFRLACSLFFMILTILVMKKLKAVIHLDKVGNWVVTALSLSLYIVLCTIIFSASGEGNQLSTVLLNSFFIVLYFVFTAVLLLVTYVYMRKRSEDEFKEKEKQNLKEYTSYLESNYNELRKFRHDYQNILMSLESFIEEDSFEKLKNYYYQSIQTTQRLMQKNDFKLSEISRLEVTEIKSIVASKLLQSQQLGIDTELEMKESVKKINTDSVMLIRCLGIILDNAIEETKENTAGFVRMAVIKEAQSVSFIVENAIREGHPKLFEMNRSGFSTKGENRGVGLSSLKELIDQQPNTILETCIDKGRFIQKIEIIS